MSDRGITHTNCPICFKRIVTFENIEVKNVLKVMLRSFIKKPASTNLQN